MDEETKSKQAWRSRLRATWGRIWKLVIGIGALLAIAGSLKGLEVWPLEPEAHPTADVRVDPSASLFAPAGDPSSEYVCLINAGEEPVQLDGWELRDRIKQSVLLGQLLLQPEAGVRVHTGEGAAGESDLYGNRGDTIWNNDEDTVEVYDADGRLVDEQRHREASGGGPPERCG
jgi:Lamin Tail Domain